MANALLAYQVLSKRPAGWDPLKVLTRGSINLAELKPARIKLTSFVCPFYDPLRNR